MNKKLIVVDNLSNIIFNQFRKWKFDLEKKNDYPFNSEIKIFDDKFFVIDIKNVLRCYFIKDGSECWNYETDKTLTITNSKNSLIYSKILVYFINNLGDVTAVDIFSGAICLATSNPK